MSRLFVSLPSETLLPISIPLTLPGMGCVMSCATQKEDTGDAIIIIIWLQVKVKFSDSIINFQIIKIMWNMFHQSKIYHHLNSFRIVPRVLQYISVDSERW